MLSEKTSNKRMIQQELPSVKTHKTEAETSSGLVCGEPNSIDFHGIFGYHDIMRTDRILTESE